MSTTVVYECKGCGDARRKARRTRRIVGCVRCLALHDPTKDADEPSPAAPPPFCAPDGHRYHAKGDMAALAATGGPDRDLRAISLEPQIPGGNDPDAVTDADVAHQLRERRGMRAAARLRAMRARPEPDGDRYAAVVWYAHGHRGQVVDEWESCATQITARFARKGERAAMLAHLRREHPRLSKAALDKMNVMAFGNALLGAAVKAYEEDVWTPAVVPTPPSPRERFIANVAERWEAAKAALLEKARRPVESRANHGEPCSTTPDPDAQIPEHETTADAGGADGGRMGVGP